MSLLQERPVARVAAARRFISLRAFDTSTAEGRSRERYRRVVISGFTAAASRAVAVLCTFLSIAIVVRHFGRDAYGVWMTISAGVGLFTFVELGTGNALQTLIADASGRDRHDDVHSLLSTAYLLLGAVAVSAGLAFAFVEPHLDWGRIYNVSDHASTADVRLATIALVGCFVVNLPLGMINNVQNGLQEAYLNSTWQAVGAICAVGGLLAAVWFSLGLPAIVFSAACGPLIANAANTVTYFGASRRDLCPRLRLVARSHAERILRTGVLFLTLSLATAATFTSDNIIAAHVLGTAAVAEYAAVMRLFSVVGILSGFFLPSFWTAYSEAVARGDVEWVRVALARSTKGTFAIAASLSVTIAAFGSVAIDRWLGSAVHPSVGLMLGAAVWVTTTAVGASFAMLLNGARVIRYQLVCSVFLGVSSIGLKIALGRHFGTSGIVWGNVVAYLLFVLIPLVFFLPKLFRGLRELRPDVA